MFKISLLIVLFLLQINALHSEVYKWTDENGKTVYGDKPSSNNADIIEIKNPPKEESNHQERYEKREKLLNIMQEERDEKIAAKKDEKENKEIQQQKCAERIKKLQKMKNSRALYQDTDDPENPIIYTDKERKIEEEKYAKYIKTNC